MARRWRNALIALLIVLLTRPGLGRVGRVLREIHPLLLLVGLYGAARRAQPGRRGGARRAGAAVGARAVRSAGEPRVVAGRAQRALVHGAARGILLVLLHRLDSGVLFPLARRPGRGPAFRPGAS